MNPTDREITRLGYRPDIDGLRALSILSVVFFHAFPSNLNGGFLGVDVFFVISGYLITSIVINDLIDERFSFYRFYLRRMRRILPVLCVLLFSCLCAGWIVLLPEEYKRLGKHIFASSGFVTNLVLMNESGYFDVTADRKPLLHLWSLGVEEQFYLLWPFILYVAWRAKVSLLVTIFLGIASSFYLMEYLNKTDPVAMFYFPLSRFWQILSGSLLAYANIKSQLSYKERELERPLLHARFMPPHRRSIGLDKLSRDMLSVIGLAILIGSFIFLNGDDKGYLSILPVIGGVIVIGSGGEAWVNRAILSNKAFVTIGLLSYSIYIWHWPLLSFVTILDVDKPSVLSRIATVCLTFIISYVTYIWIEKPVRNFVERKASYVALVATLSLGGFGALVFFMDGIPDRIPEETSYFTKVPSPSWDELIRNPECTRMKDVDFPKKCFEDRKPSIILFGDSHAASLYPGLRIIADSDGFGVTQLTQSGCPPYFSGEGFNNIHRPNCLSNNRKVLDIISIEKPDLIVIAAYYMAPDYATNMSSAVRLTVESVSYLAKASPASKIVVVGPAPKWKTALYRIVYSEWAKRLRRDPPAYLGDYLYDDFKGLDIRLQAAIRNTGASYYSVRSVLCREDACLTRVSHDNEVSLTTYDGGHLTALGGWYVLFKNNISGEVLNSATLHSSDPRWSVLNDHE